MSLINFLQKAFAKPYKTVSVADALTGAGSTADTLAGGMTAWTHAGLPTI